jgi:hypothetical protein
MRAGSAVPLPSANRRLKAEDLLRVLGADGEVPRRHRGWRDSRIEVQ